MSLSERSKCGCRISLLLHQKHKEYACCNNIFTCICIQAEKVKKLLLKKYADGLIEQPVLQMRRLFLGVALQAKQPGGVAFVDRYFEVAG